MKFAIYLVALLALLGGLFVFFKPERPSEPASSTAGTRAPGSEAAPVAAAPAAKVSAAASATTPASSPPPPQVFELLIRRGRLVSGPSVIKVHKDDEVIIRLTSDASDDVHLHGYDLHVPTRAGETTTLQFVAKQTGRFGYELHNAKAELGALEVYPR